MRDQRGNIRLHEENSISVTKLASAGSPAKTLRVMSKDISTTGVRVRTPDFLAVGARLSVEIHFADPPQSVLLYALVRWVRKLETVSMYEAGIEFEAIEPDVRGLLETYVVGKGGGHRDWQA